MGLPNCYTDGRSSFARSGDASHTKTPAPTLARSSAWKPVEQLSAAAFDADETSVIRSRRWNTKGTARMSAYEPRFSSGSREDERKSSYSRYSRREKRERRSAETQRRIRCRPQKIEIIHASASIVLASHRSSSRIFTPIFTRVCASANVLSPSSTSRRMHTRSAIATLTRHVRPRDGHPRRYLGASSSSETERKFHPPFVVASQSSNVPSVGNLSDAARCDSGCETDGFSLDRKKNPRACYLAARIPKWKPQTRVCAKGCKSNKARAGETWWWLFAVCTRVGFPSLSARDPPG